MFAWLYGIYFTQVFGRENRELLIEAINFDTHTTASATSSKQAGISLVQVRSMLAPFVLRRLKRDVLDQLSEKSTVVVRLNMTAMQQQVYDNILLSHAAKKGMHYCTFISFFNDFCVSGA